MSLLPHPGWLPLILAAVLLMDVLLSLRPPAFIRDCLDGVGYPRNWGWTLIAVKSLAIVGLLIGITTPGIGLAATTGIVAYFVCAAVAHLRARFLGAAFWLNCLGFLALAIATLIVGFR